VIVGFAATSPKIRATSPELQPEALKIRATSPELLPEAPMIRATSPEWRARGGHDRGAAGDDREFAALSAVSRAMRQRGVPVRPDHEEFRPAEADDDKISGRLRRQKPKFAGISARLHRNCGLMPRKIPATSPKLLSQRRKIRATPLILLSIG
jgi:hypothetical protein